MIVREAVTNAGVHAHPRTIGISAHHVEDELVVRVVDDGIGFDVEAMSLPLDDHYGILGMHERAEMIGADLDISSVIGTGTCVRISLKLSSSNAGGPLGRGNQIVDEAEEDRVVTTSAITM
jgi:signal transduction histidine kinase